ncbi:glycosyltransferase [Pseudoalteromonas sp. DY56-GL79]|uniref:PglD-related sugar-binding protein n=1 Tax=Pseudoalteromonas sp. DY56-GL79 TaxID=2967131 RepID=UPI00352A312A
MGCEQKAQSQELKPIILIGGGGHCRSCIDVIEAQGVYHIVGILDVADNVGTKVSGYSVVGTDEDIDKYISQNCYFMITVGQIESSAVREKIYSKLQRQKAKLATVISPLAYVSQHASIDEGSIVMHGAIVNSHAKIRRNCIINSRALIEHDAEVREHCHISTGALINGTALVNRGSFCGSGSIVVHDSIVPVNSFIKAGTRFSRKNSSKTAFLTTFFPVEERFVKDYMDSLVSQTYKDFDLVIVNDGYGDIAGLIEKYSELNIIELPSAGGIANNRASLINFSILNKYKYVVFGDVDDYFSNNRIELSIKSLDEFDILVNDFSTFDSERIVEDYYLSNRLNDNDVICAEDVLEKNVLGFSNTAVNLSKINNVYFDFNEELIAVDWYFFSCLLLMGLRAKFTSNTQTYYRQHDNNAVGINKDDHEELKRILTVKKLHYREMRKHSDEYNALYENALMLDGKNLNNLVGTIAYPLWWEKLKVQELYK